MNSDQLQGKWKQMKGSVKERWGKLTDDDIDVINGKHEQLVGKVQERYGIARDAAGKQVDDWSAVESHQSRSWSRQRAQGQLESLWRGGTSSAASLSLSFSCLCGHSGTRLYGASARVDEFCPSAASRVPAGVESGPGFCCFPWFGLDRSGTAVRLVTIPLPLANHYSLSRMLSIQRRAYLPGAPPAYVREFISLLPGLPCSQFSHRMRRHLTRVVFDRS